MSISEIMLRLTSYKSVKADEVGDLCQSFGIASADRFSAVRTDGIDVPGIIAQAKAIFKVSGTRAWCPELGRALELMSWGETYSPLSLAQLGCAMATCGWVGEIEGFLPVGGAIALGQTRFRAEGKTTLRSSDQVVRLDTEGFSVTLERLACGSLRDPKAPAFVSSASSAAMLVVGGYRIDPEMLQQTDMPLTTAEFSEAVHRVENAIDLLSMVGSDALGWVQRMVRRVSLVGAERNGGFAGRSMGIRPGDILLAAAADPVLVAESLVHESAHQYFTLGRKLGPFDIPNGGMFFSAINGKTRPIGRVALALHAVVNMYLLMDDLVESQSDFAVTAEMRLRELGPIGSSLAETVGTNIHLFSPHVKALVLKMVESADFIRSKYGLAVSEPAQLVA